MRIELLVLQPTIRRSKHADDKGHVQPALPGRHVGKVRHPQLIRTIRLELPIDPIERARRCRIRCCGAHPFAPPNPFQALAAHEPFDRAAGHPNAFPVQLEPYLVPPIDLHVGLPNSFDLSHQHIIAPSSIAAQRGVSLLRCAAPIP